MNSVTWPIGKAVSGLPLFVVEEGDQIAVPRIQASIAVGSNDDSLDHLGEAAAERRQEGENGGHPSRM